MIDELVCDHIVLKIEKSKKFYYYSKDSITVVKQLNTLPLMGFIIR